MHLHLQRQTLISARPDDAASAGAAASVRAQPVSARNHLRPRLLVVAMALPLTGACTLTPAPLQGEFAPLTPAQVQAAVGAEGPTRQAAVTGATVRWGGDIIATHPEPERSCVEVLAAPLDAAGRPRTVRDDVARTRFLACRAGFLDPAIYAEDREITVTGTVETVESRRIGGYDYPYPVLGVQGLHLWEEVRETILPPPPVWPPPYGLYWPNHRYHLNKKR